MYAIRSYYDGLVADDGSLSHFKAHQQLLATYAKLQRAKQTHWGI